jgi:hypothetical protein
MRKRVVGLVLLLGMLSVARNASADEGTNTGALEGFGAAVGFGALDLGLATTDLVFGAQGKWPPRVYSALEAAAAGAQVAICLDKALAPQPGLATPGGLGPPGSNVGWELGAAFGAIFLAHGIVTLVAPRAHLEVSTPSGPVTVAPVALSDVGHASVPGLAALGRF